MSATYHGYRSIRGDGNCYYRAICFGLFEQIIERREPRRFRRLRAILGSVAGDIRTQFGEAEHAHHLQLLACLGEAAGDAMMMMMLYVILI